MLVNRYEGYIKVHKLHEKYENADGDVLACEVVGAIAGGVLAAPACTMPGKDDLVSRTVQLALGIVVSVVAIGRFIGIAALIVSAFSLRVTHTGEADRFVSMPTVIT